MSHLRPCRFPSIAVLTVLFMAPASAAVQVIQSRPVTSPVRLDGRADDWAEAGLTLDMRSGAEFAFQNDGRNLYILFVVRTPESLKSVESTGLTVLGHRGGDKKPARGVLFLARDITAEGYILWREGQDAVLTEAEKTEIKKTARYTVAAAFAVDAKGSSYGPLRRQSDVDPPDFGMSGGGTEATYEFRVPLASPDLVPGGVGGTPGETIRVSFDWGGTDRNSLSTKASREAPNSKSGYMSGTGRTWGQEFLDAFDSMSKPFTSTKKRTFTVDVKLAETR